MTSCVIHSNTASRGQAIYLHRAVYEKKPRAAKLPPSPQVCSFTGCSCDNIANWIVVLMSAELLPILVRGKPSAIDA